MPPPMTGKNVVVDGGWSMALPGSLAHPEVREDNRWARTCATTALISSDIIAVEVPNDRSVDS